MVGFYNCSLTECQQSHPFATRVPTSASPVPSVLRAARLARAARGRRATELYAGPSQRYRPRYRLKLCCVCLLCLLCFACLACPYFACLLAWSYRLHTTYESQTWQFSAAPFAPPRSRIYTRRLRLLSPLPLPPPPRPLARRNRWLWVVAVEEMRRRRQG